MKRRFDIIYYLPLTELKIFEQMIKKIKINLQQQQNEKFKTNAY